jgi:hypothetical protein
MIDDSLGAAWHELHRLAHLLSEVVDRLIQLEARMDRIDRIDPPPTEGTPDGDQDSEG